MATLSSVGDAVTLFQADKGEHVVIAISGTYQMDIELQKEQGSKNSGSWQTVPGYQYILHDATVADTYITEGYNENLRLVVTREVSSGEDATATLTSGDKLLHTLTDDVGNVLMEFYQSGAKVDGRYLPRSPVVLTAATTITAREHANRPLLLNNVAGVVCTLPSATGTGDEYEFIVVATLTSNAYTINATPNTQGFIGYAHVMDSADTTSSTFQTVATNDIITLTFADPSQGGAIGDKIRIVDVAAGTWYTEIVTKGDAAQATPFAAT